MNDSFYPFYPFFSLHPFHSCHISMRIPCHRGFYWHVHWHWCFKTESKWGSKNDYNKKGPRKRERQNEAIKTYIDSRRSGAILGRLGAPCLTARKRQQQPQETILFRAEDDYFVDNRKFFKDGFGTNLARSQGVKREQKSSARSQGIPNRAQHDQNRHQNQHREFWCECRGVHKRKWSGCTLGRDGSPEMRAPCGRSAEQNTPTSNLQLPASRWWKVKKKEKAKRVKKDKKVKRGKEGFKKWKRLKKYVKRNKRVF